MQNNLKYKIEMYIYSSITNFKNTYTFNKDWTRANKINRQCKLLISNLNCYISLLTYLKSWIELKKWSDKKKVWDIFLILR